MPQTTLVEQREPPAALCAFPVNVLLAHLVPNDVVICQLSPPSVDLRGLAERGCVEVAEDLEAQLGGERAEEVDLDEIADGRGYEGELRETALSEGETGQRRRATRHWQCSAGQPGIPCRVALVVAPWTARLLVVDTIDRDDGGSRTWCWQWAGARLDLGCWPRADCTAEGYVVRDMA